MISAIVSRIVILLFGTLYPAYASYKAVRTKNVKEYVKWMMYWIVFAFFTCIETFTDILLSWFPFYYEIKVIIVLWLLSPATRGSSTLYRKFVHPMLTRREQEIDDYINQAKEKGYTAVLQLGSKGVNYATNVIMQTAIKAFNAPVLPGSMIRHSQSDDALASAIHTKRTHSLGDDTRDGGDIPVGARLQSTSTTATATSQVDGPSRNSRVTRSQSVDSALSKVGRSNQQQNPLNQSIIYEMDSEEEDHLLMAAQNTTAGDHLHLDFEKESSAELEEGSARARATQKRKTATTTGVARGRKASSASTGSTATATTAKTTAVRGRKKLRKDSESMEVEID